jgi:hypothetical protein
MEESTSKIPQSGPGQSGDPGKRDQQAPPIDTATDQAVDTAPEPKLEREKGAGSSEAVTRSAGPAFVVGQDPDISELLMDLSLPDDYLHILTPCISHLQLDLTKQDEIRNRLTNQIHYFTLITNGWDNRCLLLIPDQVITDPKPVNILYLKELIELLFDHFKKRMKLFIVHETNPEAKYKLFLNVRVARPLGLKIDYLPCSELRDIRNWDFEDQVDHLTYMISLGDFEVGAQPHDQAGQKPPIAKMSNPDRRELSSILARLDSFKNDKDRRRTLAQMVGLNTDNFEFDGMVSSVAWDLIKLCFSTGFIPEENRYAIDLFMALIKEDGGLNSKDKEKIDHILISYDKA